MKKIKVYLFLIMFAFNIFSPGVYSQSEAPPPEEEKTKEAASGEKETPYVKAGNVTLNFKDADIRAVLSYLSEVGGVDIVPAPDVTGTVTLKLTDKPWDVALDIIVKNYGYAYEREGEIMRVVTLGSLQQQELSTEVIPLNYTAAEDAKAAVKDMLTERGKLSYDSRTNALIVTDLATNIYKIKQVIDRIDKRTPQVMIEARILETLLENDEKMGIDWTMKIAAVGAKRPVTAPFANETWREIFPSILERFFPYGQTGTSSVTAGSGVATTTTVSEFPTEGATGAPRIFPFVEAESFTYGTLDFSQFQAVLEILKQRRRTEIISNPRITTLNNKEAKILVGRVYNFPIFDQTEQTGKWVISGYDAKELGIRLLVTPQVNENNEIVVELKPEISNYLGVEKISEELSAPLWSTREAETNVMVKDGDTIFIGGLVREDTIDFDKKVPILGDLFGDIPLVGGVFKFKSQEKEKTELIFFITVHIVREMGELTKLGTQGTSMMAPTEAAPEVKKEAKREPKKPFINFRKKKEEPAAPKKPHKPVLDWRKKNQ